MRPDMQERTLIMNKLEDYIEYSNELCASKMELARILRMDVSEFNRIDKNIEIERRIAKRRLSVFDLFNDKPHNFVYIITNPAYGNNVVKIGYTSNLKQRIQNMNSKTEILYPFSVYAVYETSAEIPDRLIHQILHFLAPSLRIRENREFYRMSPRSAYRLLENMAILTGTEDRLHLLGDSLKSSDTIDYSPNT